jgi:hypothetical protein
MTEKRFDSLVTGLVPALVLPFLTMLCIWMIRSDSSLGEFLVDFQRLHMLSKLISLSVIPNLLLFFLFIWTGRNLSARGVIFATLLLAFLMLILKIV